MSLVFGFWAKQTAPNHTYATGDSVPLLPPLINNKGPRSSLRVHHVNSSTVLSLIMKTEEK